MSSRLCSCRRARYGLFAVFLVIAIPMAWAAPVTVDSLRGMVESRSASNQPWQALTRGETLALPVEVRAGTDSGARIVQDGSSFTLRSETRVTIEAPEDDPRGLVERVQQWLGTVLYRVERRPDEFRVETPFLVSTVKGTEFVVVSSEIRSFVTLMEGSVEVENLGSGQRQMMESGDVVEIGETSELRFLQGGSDEPPVVDGNGTPAPGAIEMDDGVMAAEEDFDGETAFTEELESLRETETEQSGDESVFEEDGFDSDGGGAGFEEDGSVGETDGGTEGGESLEGAEGSEGTEGGESVEGAEGSEGTEGGEGGEGGEGV